ncbi:MAG: YjjW family glycine radical enzyme activase [Myxococcota bacterium]|jgi:pyruvate formate lyase activating enzyme|nr:YjjW family glycine radical enzyme activase [Myxococcota bacterium]
MSELSDAEVSALVNHVLPFSVVDGPGARSVIFLQGCNWRCLSCHNPHTIGTCTGCGICVQLCPHSALRQEHDGLPPHYDPSLCSGCRSCVRGCPESSDPRAQSLTVGALLERIRGFLPFITGLTISGGEPSLQPAFLLAFARALRADPQLGRLHLLIDSNGSAELELWRRLAPFIDGVCLDLKAVDEDHHQRLCGASSRQPLAALAELGALGTLHELRLLIIDHALPEVLAAARLLEQHAPSALLRLIPYREHPAPRPGLQPPAPEQLEVMRLAIEAMGLRCVVR